MKNRTVIDTHIAHSETFSATHGRCFQIIEIVCPDFHGNVGQFVMIRREDGGFQWAYPYMVLENTSIGLKVTATSESSLWDIAPGSPVALWGANGKSCEPKENDIFIAEPATFHLILPLIHNLKHPKLILLRNSDNIPEALLPDNTYTAPNGHNVASILENTEAHIYMALNIDSILEIITDTKQTFTERLFLFVSTQMGCGIGACKSCYLHNPDIPIGIPVCCNGPYLPYHSIDLEKDKNCFQRFI